MYIIEKFNNCGFGKTLEDAIKNYEEYHEREVNIEDFTFYEAKEIKVQRKFEIVKDNQ